MQIPNGLLIAAAIGVASIITGCNNEGPVEKAGKEVDKAVEQTVDKAKEASNNLTGKEGAVETFGKKVDNAIEKTGEKIDQVAEKTGDKMKEIGEAAKEQAKN